jgi:hypothetical protein
MNRYLSATVLLLCFGMLTAQPWVQDNSIFNPSGIPSFTFSQPRFADLDGDGDLDFLLGNTNRSPVFIENTGSANAPAFAPGNDIAAGVSGLDAEVGVCADLDADGDLDLVTGGFTGLHLFLNTGSPTDPVYSESPGFFAGLAFGYNPVPDLADIDNDGDLDLVAGISEDGGIWLCENTGTAANGQFLSTSTQQIGDVGLYAYPVFCDFDGDGDQDILAGRDSHGFVFFRNNGTPAQGSWQEDSASFSGLGASTYWNSPDLADLNGDGAFDLVFGTAAGPLQYFLNTGTGLNPAWQQNNSLFGGVIDVGGASSPCFYDFDGDGDLDLISGTQLGYIKYYENTGGVHAPAWAEDSGYFASIDHSIYAAVTIGDVNDDNLPDAIIGDLNGGLYFHRNTGFGFQEETGVLPPIALGGWSVPRLLDMDGDGDLDLAAGNEAGNLRFWDNQGTAGTPDWSEVTGYFSGIDVGSQCSPSFGDLDGDGDLDFVAGNLSGSVLCYLHSGLGWSPDATLFSGISTDQNAAPALADLDRDGDLDLILGDYDGTLSYWRNQANPGPVHDPPLDPGYQMFMDYVQVAWLPPVPGNCGVEHYNVYLDGDLYATEEGLACQISGLVPGLTYFVQITAVYDCGTESEPVSLLIQFVASEDPASPPVSLRNHPNPFSASTTISFTLKAGDRAVLDIFNLKGQRVRHWEGLAPGSNSLAWDGCDQHGRPLASGIYLCRLRTKEGTIQHKLMLVK